MERITYRITLNTHKNGIQRTLQGFETADNMSRRIAINLVSSGDTFEIPLDHVTAMMYVLTPDATEPSINECKIEDNTIIYDVLQSDLAEGIVEMQLKLIEGDVNGARKVLVAPRFVLEVTASNADDGKAQQSATFTALEAALVKAKEVHDSRLIRVEITDDCIFRAYYADGTMYENDSLHEALYNGNAILSESFAHGNTGIRAGEDTDNSMYYSNVSRSASLDANKMFEDTKGLLEEVTLRTVYTVFGVDMESGLLLYTTNNYLFRINAETGELEFYEDEKYSEDNIVEKEVF